MSSARAASDLDPADEEELMLIVSGLGMPQEGGTEYWVSEHSECIDCISDLQ